MMAMQLDGPQEETPTKTKNVGPREDVVCTPDTLVQPCLQAQASAMDVDEDGFPTIFSTFIKDSGGTDGVG